MKKSIIILALSVFAWNTVLGQTTAKEITNRKFYIGSTFFMLGNLVPKNKPDFAQLNFGYRITPENVVALEVKTWKYAWPLGIPFGDDFEASEYEYPGYIREYGFALVYQHFWWKGLYSSVHAMNALQKYADEDNNKIQNGFQLFITYRLLGYHFQLFKNRAFIEPSIAITHWPINTHTPESFKVLEAQWPNYFLFEPGLHFGINF